MRVAIVERDEKVLEELKKGLKRVDPNYELAGIAGNGQSAYEMITVMQGVLWNGIFFSHEEF